jgi:hypothetical protein
MRGKEGKMTTTVKRTLVGALSAALVLTSFSIAPAHAVPAGKKPAAAPAQAADTMPTDISSRRRHYRGTNPAAALAMFGLVAGTVAAVAASRRHRHHYGVPYAYGVPYGGYYGAPYGYGPYGGYGYGPRYW